MAKIKLLLQTDIAKHYNPSDPELLRKFNERITQEKDVIEKFNPRIYEIDFIAAPGKEYDVVIVSNFPPKKHQPLRVKKGNVFAIMQEPPYRFLTRYIFKNLSQYDQVFGPVKSAENVVLSQPYLEWYFDDYTTHQKRLLPKKTKLLSCVMSQKSYFRGHKQRLKFLKNIKPKVTLDHFGNGFRFIENKGDALLPYYYSIAIENYSGDYYFSEKINDCFLAYTIPLYHGCTNIDKFFPRQSYIKVDINDIPRTISLIKNTLNETTYKERLPYIKEARENVLKKHHMGAFLKNEITKRVMPNLNNPIVDYHLSLTRNYWNILFIPQRFVKKLINFLLKKFSSLK